MTFTPTYHQISYVNASQLFEGYEDAFDAFVSYCPFPWGGAQHSLITVREMALHLEALKDQEDLPLYGDAVNQIAPLLERMLAMPTLMFINLEK
jgi:hypothetical protein